MPDLFAALVAFFLIDPLKAEMADKLAAARAPQAVVAQVSACARSAAPQIVERATADPWWAMANTFNVWVGSKGPEALLVEIAPACAGAVAAAQPFLTGRQA
ncbi:long-chain-fatty-acid-CoA ligase (plasmid) [Methylorubrum populi]|uniref:Long-chain-fatty-acid-CoA ligase n=1 Tax=Methylorubrum populi TaxID=223967 RepID=A0A169RK06_9HYPH|nr:hypothetical protein [Methylorubrum populi]BAU94052.1 long-chain-fatty-acid-CoA ligase [Methylorubrum populi]